MSIQSERINKLRNILDDDSQALFISDENNVYYFSGVEHSEGKMLVTKDASYLLVDFRYSETARKNCTVCEVIEFSSLIEDTKKIFKKHNINTVMIESSDVRLDFYNRILREFNTIGVSVISDDTLSRKIFNLRMVKSDDEIENISKAQEITEKAYYEVLNYIKPGVCERKIALELEYLMKKYGAQKVSFDLITITGKKTSLPHGVPTDGIISEGDFFTMDIGAQYEGYHSDMTRTVAVKSCCDEQREIYNIVLNAQLSALSKVRAGVKAFDVDKTARDIIENAGYGKNFGHSTGHGVGLDIHEQPYVNTRGDRILSENMVITVEPGIYIEEKFGVRIEDMVLVKNDGYKNFATISKELIIV